LSAAYPDVTDNEIVIPENDVQWFILYNIVTHMPLARQRLGKHIPEVTLSTTEGHPLLGKGPIKTHS
jgi:hypothetical protein